MLKKSTVRRPNLKTKRDLYPAIRAKNEPEPSSAHRKSGQFGGAGCPPRMVK